MKNSLNMVNSNNLRKRNGAGRKTRKNDIIENGITESQYKDLVSMGQVSLKLINELYSPIDAVSRFISLMLQSADEDSGHRQFLLDSKSGMRRAATLLKRLNKSARKLEKKFVEVVEVVEENG